LSHGKEFREKRRRGFDDDDFQPPRRSKFGSRPPSASFGAPQPVATGPTVGAVVKWFNPEKGFGFVALDEGGGDAFLHAAVLARAGREEVAAGATLKVRTGAGLKGPQVTEVLEVDDSTATPAPRRSGAPRRDTAGPATRMAGTTKWYDPGRGFGFVSVTGGGQDVFVHATVLQRGGIDSLAPGQRVTMDVAAGRRNPEAVSIQLAD
jgi:CspA family cold shock protein